MDAAGGRGRYSLALPYVKLPWLGELWGDRCALPLAQIRYFWNSLALSLFSQARSHYRKARTAPTFNQNPFPRGAGPGRSHPPVLRWHRAPRARVEMDA